MALQLYVQPRDGELIGQGIMQAAEGISLGIEKYYQRKQENENMERATSFFSRAAQSDPELAKMLGVQDPKDTAALKAGIKGMGGPQKFMEMAGLYQQMQQQKMQQQAMAQRQAEIERKDNSQKALSVALSRTGGDIQQAIPLALQMGADPGEVKEMAQAYAQSMDGGQAMTSAMRDADAIIANEIAAGKLPKDPTVIASRRAELVAAGGRDQERFDNAGTFVRRKDGSEPMTAVKNRKTGQIGFVDKDGNFSAIDPNEYMPSTTSDANPFMNEEAFGKMSGELIQKENSVKAINKFMGGIKDLPSGVEKLGTRISLAAKTIAGAKDSEFTPEEKAMGLAKARQQRLLGALRTTILGPGVLTEIDAQRILDAVGGDVAALTTNPGVMKEVLSEILAEKMSDYEQSLDVYNAHVAGRYGRAGYKQRKKIEAFRFDEPAAPAASGPRIISVEPVK